MKQCSRRPIVFVFALFSLAVMGLMTVSPASADNGCGIGWYYNTSAGACQPYTGGPNVTGCISATGRRGHVTAGVCVGN
jgi:hypothetical protein